MKYVRKSIFTIGYFFLLAFSLQAQDTTGQSTYLLDRFVPGSVLLKSGRIEQAALNYDAALQGIAFEKDGKHYNLTGLETIDTVYINDRKFIPATSLFYELATIAPVELYATYSCKMQPVKATADNNGSSRKTLNQVSNTVSEVYLNRPYRAGYAMEFRKHFWLKRYRDFYKVSTARQVIKLFPKKETAIKDFVKTNNTDFSNQNDVVKLLSFCLN